MPLPWKKVKSAKISQLVNDHLQISQKRRGGSSLVVETGFPTSLIDLFFKNREKLKKPSKKKRRNPPIPPFDDVYNPAIVDSPISYPSPPPPSPVRSPMPQRHSSILPPPPSCVDEIRLAESSVSDGAVEEERSRECGAGNGGGVLVRVVKVFVVATLALVTKRLTLGITISAALLLLLEYVGKHSSAAKAAVVSIIRFGCRLLGCNLISYDPTSRLQHGEIQTIVSNDNPAGGVKEIQLEKETESKPTLQYQEIKLLEMAMKREESIRHAADSYRRKARKTRIKSKMQKLVPKKFRRSTNAQESAIDDDEEQAEQCDIDEESENRTSSSSSSSDPRLWETNEETNRKIEVLTRRYMPLCLIVLVGLIGGRPFAFVLTLSWFLLLKLGQKLLPRSVKFL